MLSIIKKFLTGFSKNTDVDEIIREYDIISYIINDCHSMEDFIYCKKKIRQFQNRWDKEEGSFGSNMSNKLNKQYSTRLVRQKYQIGLYAQKKRKKT